MLYQPPPRVAYSPPHISIDGTNLNAVEHFTYLGSVISNAATVSKDFDNRMSKASSSFGRLSKRVWQSHSLRLSTKIQVYRAVVVPTLLNGAETWVLYRKQIRLLERFHQRCFRSVLGIKWQDHVSNEEVLKRASLPSIESILLRVQLRRDGHVTRMEDVRKPKAVFLQRALRRKARSWCSENAIQRSAEETACTGGNQPSVMAAGGLRLRQLALISEKSHLEA